MKYELNKAMFGDGRSMVEQTKTKEVSSSKFNIKIRKDDLRLIDTVSELAGKPRSAIVVSLVKDILHDMLETMAVDEKDAAALLALYADEKHGKDYQDTDGWSAAVFGVTSYNAIGYWMARPNDYDPGDKYREIARRIEEVKK